QERREPHGNDHTVLWRIGCTMAPCPALLTHEHMRRACLSWPARMRLCRSAGASTMSASSRYGGGEFGGGRGGELVSGAARGVVGRRRPSCWPARCEGASVAPDSRRRLEPWPEVSCAKDAVSR